MEYKILEKIESLTVTTKVEYTFDDGSKETIEVAHFEPESEECILQNIQNRYESECLKKLIEKGEYFEKKEESKDSKELTEEEKKKLEEENSKLTEEEKKKLEEDKLNGK